MGCDIMAYKDSGMDDATPPVGLTAALEYLTLGFSPLPLCPADHVSVGLKHSRKCKHRGKRPFFPNRPDHLQDEWKDYQTRRATEDEIRDWWKALPDLNVGAAMGPVSGIVGIDIDHEDGEKKLLELSGGNIPPTWEYTTGKGRRLLYRLPPGVRCDTAAFSRPGTHEEMLRFMSTGSQVVLPPSRHPSGGMYRWVDGRSPADIPATDVPDWFVKARSRQTKTIPVEGELVGEGGRNNYLAGLAGKARDGGACPEAILALLATENEVRCDPPLLNYEVENIAYSISKYDRPEFSGVVIKQGLAPNVPVPDEAQNPKGPDDVAGIADLKKAGATLKWVWPGWIQRGVLTVIAAEGGTGKTRLTADIVRRVMRVGAWPDGTKCEPWPSPCTVLWVMSDNHHDEMVSLAEAFDIAPFVKINSHPHPEEIYGGINLETSSDHAVLEKRIKVVNPLLVVIDTVGNATSLNLSKQEDARAFYQPLQQIAHRCDVAMLCLTHLNSGGKVLGRRALEKVRVAWRLSAEKVNDHTCKRRLEIIKSNSKAPAPLGVMMSDHGNEYDTNPPPPPEERENGDKVSPAAVECCEWLTEMLAETPMPVSDLRTKAEEKGWSSKTFYAAKPLAGVVETVVNNRKWWGNPGATIPKGVRIKGIS